MILPPRPPRRLLFRLSEEEDCAEAEEEESSEVTNLYDEMANDQGPVLVVMGASGDLAKKSIYPSLWALFKASRLPEKLHIIGYARSKLTVQDLRQRTAEFIQVREGEEDQLEKFWSINSYVPGSYDDPEKARDLTEALRLIDRSHSGRCDRLFYVALPPSVYESVTELIASHWKADPAKGSTRVALEKPFGSDLETSERLDRHLAARFHEDEVVRIDHYLCLEMVQAIMALRFGNGIFQALWSNRHVESVLITFKEDFGTYGRSGYFDKSGIVRDVMQNHLLQVLALVAMEPPESSDDREVRDKKTRLIQQIRPVVAEDVVLGQYVGNPESKLEGERLGYKDDRDVPKDSKTPTFAAIAFHIDNERWAGVPFIMRCGKATNEVKDEVRIQFRQGDQRLASLFGGGESTMGKNELVIQLKPSERISLRIRGKRPGMGLELDDAELAFDYASKYGESPTGPYERVLLSVIGGDSPYLEA